MEYRIEIEGRFSGNLIPEVHRCWELSLTETSPRSFIVDISQLSGYDAAGYILLQRMHQHGVIMAARNPRSLAFLNEISNLKPGPTLVYQAENKRPASENQSAARTRAAAAGE